MTMKKTLKLLMVVLLVLLISCGDNSMDWNVGGSTIVVPGNDPFTYAPTEVVSIGPISGQSSKTVNSVTYRTETATVTLNGNPGVPNDLHSGYVVTVHGMLEAGWKDGDAERVSFDANVIGPVEYVDPSGRGLSVMGQSVRIDADTRFTPPLDFSSLIMNLDNGTHVQVSGLPDLGGEIVATHVQIETDRQQVQVIGEISALDLGAMRFRINQLIVDYASTRIMDLPNGTPSQGMVVIARGTLDNTGELRVSELKSHVDTSEFVTGSLVQLTGYITRYDLRDQLIVNGLNVDTEFLTLFHNGLSSDLATGIKVEIDGRWGIDDRVKAKEIWFGTRYF